VVVTAGCLAPALDTNDFRYKTSRTAEEVASALQTAALAIEAAETHGLPLPAIEVALRDAEQIIDGASGSFQVVKPPNDESDSLRQEAVELIDQAEEMVGDARIALQRSDLAGAIEALQESESLAGELEQFSKRVEP
jgi:hypothetical protein